MENSENETKIATYSKRRNSLSNEKKREGNAKKCLLILKAYREVDTFWDGLLNKEGQVLANDRGPHLHKNIINKEQEQRRIMKYNLGHLHIIANWIRWFFKNLLKT